MLSIELSLLLIGFIAFIIVSTVVLHIINFKNKYDKK